MAALSWLGRGLATVLVSCIVTLAVVSSAFFVVLQVSPHASWHMAWLLPLSVLLVVGGVFVARQIGVAEWQTSRLAAAVLELASGGGALLLSWFCVHRIATNSGSSILLSAEDNGAWVNTVGLMHDAHGVTAQTAATVSTFGPVAEGYLAFVREGVGGVLPNAVSATRTAAVVVVAHCLLVVLAPVVAALVARRTLRFARPGLTLLSWFVATALMAAVCLVTPVFGFLTAALALLLVVAAAALLSGQPLDPRSGPTVVRWLVTAILLYAAGSSWVPLIPLGALALAGWYLSLAWRAVAAGPWATVRLVGLLAIPTAVLGACLVEQYRDVISPIGGGDALLIAGGNTPAAGPTITSAAVGLTALVWAGHRLTGPRSRRSRPSMATALTWLLGYTGLVLLVDGWRTMAAPHYGSVKLLYVIMPTLVILGVADLMASSAVGTRRLDVAAALVVAAIFAGTADQGPVYTAVQSHWPKPIPLPAWVGTVDREVASKSRVLCLNLTGKPDETVPNLDTYNCDRWAASLQGRDDPTALTWRFVQLGRRPVSDAVALLDKSKTLPWRIVVVGSSARLKDPKGWWAPIVKQPGRLTFVAAGS